jgi:hypothetical protein
MRTASHAAACAAASAARGAPFAAWGPVRARRRAAAAGPPRDPAAIAIFLAAARARR